jgi:hypothetical protein
MGDLRELLRSSLQANFLELRQTKFAEFHFHALR